jgi:hypothetical protein
MIKRFFTWLGKILNGKPVTDEPKQSNTVDILQAATSELVNRPAQVKEDKWFQQSNNIIDEFVYDHPTLITPMGVFYKKGDPRNTYDPDMRYEVEDYDGTILKIGGGSGFDTREVVNPEDDKEVEIWNKQLDNTSDMEHINRLRKEWADANKSVNFSDHVKQNSLAPDEPTDKPDKTTE